MDSKYLKRVIRLSPLAKSKAYHCARFLAKEDNIKKYVEKKGENYHYWKPILKEAMIQYHWDPDEVFMYDYCHLSPSERKEFVPEYEKNIFCDKVNDYDDSKVFDSKWESYNVFKEYYKRDCCCLTQESLRKRNIDLDDFLNNHLDFIIKPDSNASGRGIKIVHSHSLTESKELIKDLVMGRPGRYVLEELIKQSPLMGHFHPLSVNSLRIRSFRFDDRVEILPSNMRIGKGSSYVDNTGQGGISAAIDDNGFIFTACDESGNIYDTHPDSKEQIVGIRVPFWEEAKRLVEILAGIIPSVRYVGWDLALTDNGWVMIEGNDKGMFVGIQKPRQKGFRPEMNKILSELNMRL